MSYSKEDFLKSTKPYEYLYNIKNQPFLHAQVLEEIKENARTVGVRNFAKIYKAYLNACETK